MVAKPWHSECLPAGQNLFWEKKRAVGVTQFQRVQVFANGQRCDDINYYGRTVAAHDLLNGREYNRNKAMEDFDEVNDPRIARAVHQGGTRTCC